MFLRRIRPRGRGRRQEYWALLESYRTAKGSRHRVVAYLGKLSAKEISGWEKLAARLDGKAPAGATLFGPPPAREEGGNDVERVELKNLRLENLREFGQVYLAWTLWRLLELDGVSVINRTRQCRSDSAYSRSIHDVDSGEPSSLAYDFPSNVLIRTCVKR